LAFQVLIGGAFTSKNIDTIGNNAGKIWTVLNQHQPEKTTTLMHKTNLNNRNFFEAVGWLARENKINKEGLGYSIGTTNLTESIGRNAGMVWTVLDIWEEVDVSSIARLTHLTLDDTYAALGWLAKEEKIDVVAIDDKQKYCLTK